MVQDEKDTVMLGYKPPYYWWKGISKIIKGYEQDGL